MNGWKIENDLHHFEAFSFLERLEKKNILSYHPESLYCVPDQQINEFQPLPFLR